MGSLTGRKPSAILMDRIHLVSGGHVCLDVIAQEEWDASRCMQLRDALIATDRPLVGVIIRGESNREGQSRQHMMTGDINVFESNMVAYLENLGKAGFRHQDTNLAAWPRPCFFDDVSLEFCHA